MKLRRVAAGHLELQLAPRERRLLAQLIGPYPSIPEDYHRPLAERPAQDADPALERAESLRRESLAAHRSTLRETAQSLIARLLDQDPPAPLTLDLEADTLERLLQIVNDVRVGAWIRLGCPDPTDADHVNGHPDPAWALRLELAGDLEALLLQAWEASDEDPPAKDDTTTV